MKEIAYNWLDEHCSGLVKFETNSLPVDIFFIDTSIKDRELFFNYNKKRKLLIVYPYVESNVEISIRAGLENYSYNRDVQLDLIGNWFSDKFNYPINSHAIYVPFTDITEKIYSQYLTETQSHNFNKVYKLIDNYVNQQDIKVEEMDSLLYCYNMPNRNNQTLMVYNRYDKIIGIMDKELLNLLNKNFNYTNTILEIIFKKWYIRKYNKPVDSVLISNINK
jgi:succinate dehydrogenase flavin-adding protein (antitoxin of CptAB toxin-antitoxin module)